jgi:hypothetical protein
MTESENKKASKAEAAPKECFVIMPISDPEGYPKGHFEEVFSQLISPAVVAAGFKPTRADKVAASNLIHVDVISRVISADLCICDLSSKNPNVMFEYGIRQAFDKPTVLIKDDKTDRIFDLSGMRDIEYNCDLRIAAVLQKRSEIQNAIEQTIALQGADGQVFSLVHLLSLAKAAQLPESNSTPESAQFKIIQAQLNTLQEMLVNDDRNYSLKSRSLIRNILRDNTDRNEKLKTQNFSKEYSIVETNGKFLVMDRKTQEVYTFKDQTEIPAKLKSLMSYGDRAQLEDIVPPF